MTITRTQINNDSNYMYVQWNPSIPDTLGPEKTFLIIEVSLYFRGWMCTMARHGESFGFSGACPYLRGVCNLGDWIRGVPLYTYCN